MTVINSNSAAMLTANSINQNDRAMTSTMERLSTGKRINSAADDAAGLAIATKMTAQVRGLDQAGRNANNATSMVQLADGAAEQISNILQRMREIVVQAADGSNSTSDQAVLDVEFKEASSEIDRIVNVTEFNGKKLLDGSAGGVGVSSVAFQIGANAGQQLTVDFSDFNLAAGTTAGTNGVDTLTITGASVSAGSSLVLTDAEGDTIEITDAKIVAAQGVVGGLSVGTTLQDTDYDVLAQAINTAINANANFAQMEAANSGANTITFTQDVAGSGSLLAANQVLSGVASALGGAATLANTEIGSVAGGAGNPMATNLSGFTSTGMLASVSVDGAAAASSYDNTLNAIDAAIEGVATQRATFGATMNRLEYAVDNLASSSLATSTARGRIEDANYATETTSLARSQIIAQAGTAMLAQANQKAQSVLALLQ
jgi:flagellin